MSQLNDQLTLIQNARDDIKTVLEEKGQTVSKDIRTYAEAINNISGESNIKLYTNKAEMLDDTAEPENEYGVVYSQ